MRKDKNGYRRSWDDVTDEKLRQLKENMDAAPKWAKDFLKREGIDTIDQYGRRQFTKFNVPPERPVNPAILSNAFPPTIKYPDEQFLEDLEKKTHSLSAASNPVKLMDLFHQYSISVHITAVKITATLCHTHRDLETGRHCRWTLELVNLLTSFDDLAEQILEHERTEHGRRIKPPRKEED